MDHLVSRRWSHAPTREKKLPCGWTWPRWRRMRVFVARATLVRASTAERRACGWRKVRRKGRKGGGGRDARDGSVRGAWEPWERPAGAGLADLETNVPHGCHVSATWMPRGFRLVALEDGRMRLGEGDAHVAKDGTTVEASCGGARLVRWNKHELRNTTLQVADVHVPFRSQNAKQEDLELEWTPLAEDLLDGNGLEVQHLEWHPHSENHLGLLTSDNVFRLYNVAQDTAQPEQEFRLSFPEDGDYHDLADAQMDAFTFSRGYGWERFAVYFSSSFGNLYYLCPVAPFGAVVPCKEVPSMRATSELRAGPTADAADMWLDCALGEGAFPGRLEDDSAFATVRPHCLEWSSPCLVGPFPEQADCATERHEPMGQAAGGLLYFSLYTAGGRVMVHVRTQEEKVQMLVYLLYGSLMPAWLEDTPHFGRNVHGRIDWVSTSAGVLRPDRHPTLAFLLDCIEFEGCKGRYIQVVRDESREFGLYVVLGNRAYSMDVGYAKDIVHMLEGNEPSKHPGDGIPTRLGKPSLEELVHPDLAGSSHVVGAISSGGVLEEGQLLVWTSTGHALHLQRQAGKAEESTQEGKHPTSNLGSGASSELAAFEEESWRELDSLYIDLISTPEAVVFPPAPACAEDSIEGQKYLHACAVQLKERYFGYIHKAHDDLLRRSEHLKDEISQQELFQQNVEGKLANARAAMEKLRSRASQAESLAENLQERLKLLFELERSATPPLSIAERDFVRQLEDLSSGLPLLQDKLKPMAVRAEKLESADAGVASSVPAMSSAQLKQLYASISRDSGQVQLCIDKVRRLQHQLEGLGDLL